jgi:hypothetical protein
MRRYIVVLSLVATLCAATAVMVRGQSARTTDTGASGRYQIIFNPNVRADTFLLDTQTGKVWLRTTYTDLDGKPDVWEYQDRADNPEQLHSWISSHRTNP